jgi:CheY-like chemotaxis protein
MRKGIKKEFGQTKPKAIVLDDYTLTRRMTARRLRARGFEVNECANISEFQEIWRPGMTDVIVADWQLTLDESELGDQVLGEVREKDWDVPFILISGKLNEDDLNRAKVLQTLLEEGGARFVKRGENGIKQVCDDAEDLIERRDSTLLKVILSLRKAAESGLTIKTSNGPQSVSRQLAALVSKPKKSHDVVRPIAERRSARARVDTTEQ